MREISRKAYLEHNDKDAMVKAAHEQIQTEFKSIIASLIMSILLQLAVELIVRWLIDKLSDPGAEYKPDEPGYIES